MGRTRQKGMEAPDYPYHSRPFEICIVRRMEQHSNEKDQCINTLQTEERTAARGVGVQQILITLVDFHLQLYLSMRV